MRGGIMSKRFKYILLILFVLSILGLTCYASHLSGNPTFKILYEQQFDKKIDEVAFDSYKENGNIVYYPKIIAFEESEEFTIKREYKHERFDDERVFKNVNKEIRIFSSKGKQIKSISGDKYNFYAGGKTHISENANYFTIMQVVRTEDLYSTLMGLYFSPEGIDSLRTFEGINSYELEDIVIKKYEKEYGKLIEPSFSMYNDKGDLLWKKEKLWETYYLPEDFYIKKIYPNGDILGKWSCKWWIIDISGNKTKSFPPEFDNYLIDGLRVGSSKDRKYTAVGFKRHPTDFYKELPGKSSEPGIALLDSNRNLLWKKSLDNYLLNWVVISPQGSYIGVETYTMAGVLYDKKSQKKLREPGEGIAAKTGCLFDKKGNLVMNLPSANLLWETSAPFSEDERYFACPKKEHLAFYDISEKKLVYEKNLPSNISGISVSNDGKCSVVTREQENLEYYSTGRPSKIRDLYKVFIIDEKGNTVWDGGEMEGTSAHLLGWYDKDSFFAIIDKEKGYIKIVKVSI